MKDLFTSMLLKLPQVELEFAARTFGLTYGDLNNELMRNQRCPLCRANLLGRLLGKHMEECHPQNGYIELIRYVLGTVEGEFTEKLNNFKLYVIKNLL